MQDVKNQTLLARAFVRMLALRPALRDRVVLVMVGEGPLRPAALAVLQEAGAADLAWLPGERSDVPQVLRGLHAFCSAFAGRGHLQHHPRIAGQWPAGGGHARRRQRRAGGRRRHRFSLGSMVASYADVYESEFSKRGRAGAR